MRSPLHTFPFHAFVFAAFLSMSCSSQDQVEPASDVAEISDQSDLSVLTDASVADIPPNDDRQDTAEDLTETADFSGADSSTPDLIVDLPDTGGTVPLDGFGVISGDCGVIDTAELTSPDSMLFVSRIDFSDDPFDTEEDSDQLTAGGLEILLDDNAGGSSLLSEIFAYEMLNRCELAVLIKTETEVCYTESSSITDILVEIDGETVGVSVTRAFNYPPSDPLPLSEALRVLTEKLDGIESSTESVCEEDAWVKQILFILAYSDEKAETMIEAYESLSALELGNTIVIVTVTDGDDSFIY